MRDEQILYCAVLVARYFLYILLVLYYTCAVLHVQDSPLERKCSTSLGRTLPVTPKMAPV